MNEKIDPQPGSATRKTLSLDSLWPEKIEVFTSQGTLYIRHMILGDAKHFDIDDAAELAKAAISQLVGREKDKRDKTSLTAEDVDALTDKDFEALAPAIAEQCQSGDLLEGVGPVELGNAIKRGLERARLQSQRALQELHQSIDSSYSFLGKSALEKLQEQMAGLSNIQSSIETAAERLSHSAGDLSWLTPSADAQRATQSLTDPNPRFSITEPERASPFEPPLFRALPNPEDTPLGRATLAAAENSREAIHRMDALVEVVGGINQTLVKDVLPAWFESSTNDQKNAKEAFIQAGDSLWWAKWAVMFSALVTFGVSWWQISVTRELDQDNSAAVSRSEALLRDQLNAQRANEALLREMLKTQQASAEQLSLEIKQMKQALTKQAADTKKIREQLKAQSAAPAPAPPAARHN